MERTPRRGLHTGLDVVARSVRVQDIARPLPRVDAAWDVSDIQIELGEHQAWFGLVVDGRQTVGYVALDDHGEGESARAIALPLHPDLLIEESMPVVELLGLFRRNAFFFAIRGNSVVSVVSWIDVDCPLGRVVFAARVMELEYALNDLLQPHEAAALGCLSAARLAKARELHALKTELGKATRAVRGSSLISCLTLADKATAARKLMADQARSTWAGPVTFRAALQLIERVRNITAHGNSLFGVVSAPAQLSEVLDVVEYATKWIREGRVGGEA